MKKPGSLILTVLIGVLLVGTLTSCEEFFTTSLGTWAARDKSKMASNVDANNVADLVKQAKNDPELSQALLKKISEIIDNVNDPGELLALQQGALDAAANASGLVPALLDAVGQIMNENTDESAILNIISDTLDSLGNLGNTADYLYTVLNKTDDYTGLDSGSLAFGAAMLVAADAKEAVNNSESFESAADYFEQLADEGGKDALGEEYKNTLLAIEIASNLSDLGELGTILEDLGLKDKE